jgi:mono/diheme cytochrome c family protein
VWAVAGSATGRSVVRAAGGGVLIALLLWPAATHAVRRQAAAGPRALVPTQAGPRDFRHLLDQYCVTCHNERTRSAGLTLDRIDLANVPGDAEVWAKVVRKLRGGMMPPPGRPRPEPAALTGFASWVETTLDREAAIRPNPGRPRLHRLNRAEYANAIRDLLALDVDTATLLPPDDSSYGFDNIADVLGLSPVLLERYLSAARKISALAVGDPAADPRSVVFRARQDLSQNRHIEGLPLGTVGGLIARPTLPADGEYVLQARLFRTNLGAMRGLEYARQVEFTVDGERVHLVPVGGDADLMMSQENPTIAGDTVDGRLRVRVRLKAGPRTLTVAFLEKSAAQNTRLLQPFVRSSHDTVDPTGVSHIEMLTITGPFDPAAPADTPSRRRIFSCRPVAPADEAGCAHRIVTALGRRAYRGMLTDADVQALLKFYQVGRAEGSFETGIEKAIQRILASPNFLFRVERDPATAAPGSVYRLTDLELASRLSFFLWSTIPDDELLRLADEGKLTAPAVLGQQVRRMLADEKSQALVGNFAGQWLYLRNLRNMVPNSDEFPDFDDNLRQAMLRETELFFQSIIREDRSAIDLLTSSETFVNERLARHYGVPNVYGSHFRRVTLADDARKGLLGKGSILLVTSRPTRTSPVLRGKWILENLLGTPPPPPPPDVPPLTENGAMTKPKSVREQMEEHRANPGCAGCHRLMDPLGFALENFDAVGAWRQRDGTVPIDASGQLADGTPVDGVATLRQALVRRPEAFVATLTEKLLTYALGRGVTAHDMPVIRAIVRDAARTQYRFSSIVSGIVTSPPFQMRIKPSEDGEKTTINAGLAEDADKIASTEQALRAQRSRR